MLNQSTQQQQDVKALDDDQLLDYFEQACAQASLMFDARMDCSYIDAAVDRAVAEMVHRDLA